MENTLICGHCHASVPIEQVQEYLDSHLPGGFGGLCIDVYNCRWNIGRWVETGKSGRTLDYITLTDSQYDALDDLVYESIEDAGGAINISGQYPLSEALLAKIFEMGVQYETYSGN